VFITNCYELAPKGEAKMTNLLNVLTGRSGRKVATQIIPAPAGLAKSREAQIRREWERLQAAAMTPSERSEIDEIFSRAM
jgi:hypothetical protein